MAKIEAFEAAQAEWAGPSRSRVPREAPSRRGDVAPRRRALHTVVAAGDRGPLSSWPWSWCWRSWRTSSPTGIRS